MRSKSSANAFILVLLMGISFGTGWWVRGSAEPQDQASTRTEPRTAGTPNVTRTQPTGRSSTWPDNTSAANTRDSEARGQASSPPASQPRGADKAFADEFRALLDERAFSAAMDLYAKVERRSSSDAAQLRTLVIQYLQTYLSSGDDISLTRLADAFLSRYYDDLDVILVLAQHHLQSDHPTEAAHSYQLAFTYAFMPAEQQKVRSAFKAFVQQVDEQFVAQTRTQELIGFYETLERLDLAEPSYLIRLAHLYLAHGEAANGRDLLVRLSADPAVASQAKALLNDIQSNSVESASSPDRKLHMDSIALAAAGSHYHLPLRVNDLHDIRLIIDTGATTTTLTQAKFDAINRYNDFTEIGPQSFNTASGVAQGTVYRVSEFQIGNHVLTDVHIAVLDFGMPDGIDGLLGMNVLRNFRFEVDQDEHRLYLQPRQ